MCDELLKSPMFNLSMASKELFHSNLLYWMSVTYPQLFLKILENLNIDTSSWEKQDWVSYREKNHFDLSLYLCKGKKEECLLIIENKVKSIPQIHQLRDYEEKKSDKTQLLLLSLCSEFGQKQDIQKGWKIASYADLSMAIRLVLPQIKDPYHHALLDDYCFFIDHLHRMQQRWILNVHDNYVDTMVNVEPEILKLEDVQKKVLISRMADEIQKRYSNAKYAVNKDIERDKGKDSIGQVYVNTGMSHTTAILDVKIRISGNLLFVIQLQGKQFKHCIEVLGKDDKAGNVVIEALKEYLNKPTKQFILDQQTEKLVFDSHFLTIAQRQGTHYGFNEDEVSFPNSKNAFCKFGDSFIYQYALINKNVKIGRIIDVIIETINKIQTIIKTSITQ